jgi:hypothetical protein
MGLPDNMAQHGDNKEESRKNSRKQHMRNIIANKTKISARHKTIVSSKPALQFETIVSERVSCECGRKLGRAKTSFCFKVFEFLALSFEFFNLLVIRARESQTFFSSLLVNQVWAHTLNGISRAVPQREEKIEEKKFS